MTIINQAYHQIPKIGRGGARPAGSALMHSPPAVLPSAHLTCALDAVLRTHRDVGEYNQTI
jgi:hypothetical protein